MGSAPRIEKMFEKLVKPSSPTLDHPRVYKLSIMDLPKKFHYAPLVLFYPFTEGLIDTPMVRIEQLEKSLSEILSIYCPFAGRFSSADLHKVDCGDQGVLFLVKKVSARMNDLIEKREDDLHIVDTLIPSSYLEQGQDVVDAPLVKVHVSVFECGGLALCVSFVNNLGDGFTVAKFVFDWAKLMTTGRSTEVNVSFNGAELFSVPPQSKNLSYDPPPTGQEKMLKIVARRIFFNGETVTNLKNHVTSSTGGWNFDRPPSKVEVVTALMWSGLIRAAQEKNGCQRPFMITISVNLRGKHVLSNLFENTIGNIFVLVPIKFIPGETKMELYDLVCLIRKTMQEKVSEASKAPKEEISSINVKGFDEVGEWWNKEEFDVMFGTSLCRFPLSDADFGWGKPSRITFPTWDTRVFVLFDDIQSGDGGLEVILNLDEPDMENSIAHINNAMHVFNGKTKSSTSPALIEG